MRDPKCIRRRLLALSLHSYDDQVPVGFAEAAWPHRPENHAGHWKTIDRALIGQIDGPGGTAMAPVVAFRGTLDPRGVRGPDGIVTLLDWLNNTGSALIPFDDNPAIRTGKVHFGFKRSLDVLWPDIAGHLAPLIAGQARPRLFITGHSKGGALAVLAAMRAAMTWPNASIRVVTLAGARAGDRKFREAYMARPNIVTDRYEVRLDPVPHLPPSSEDDALTRRFTDSVLDFLANAGVEVDDIPDYVSVGRQRLGGANVASSLLNSAMALFGSLIARRPPRLDISTFLQAHQITAQSQYDVLICSEKDLDACDHQ
jgi:hypothetical protein